MFIQEIQQIINEAQQRYAQGEVVEQRNQIPTSSDDIPLETNKWLRIDDVVCVFIDMKNSTQLSVQTQDKTTASVYQYFTNTAVKMLNAFNASYIDIKGDGAFGLFEKKNIYRALCSAISFKTFSYRYLSDPNTNSGIFCHIGMDMKSVLVKRMGLRKVGETTLKQNEVWAGKPVNMASKLAPLGENNNLVVSDRVFNVFDQHGHEKVLYSCGCLTNGVPSGEGKVSIWFPLDLNNDPKFDFQKAYCLETYWCKTHGQEFCNAILNYDGD